MILKLGELFCGPGGIAYGAHNAELKYNNENYKIQSIWANDYDKDTCDTYQYNFPHTNVICKDVSKLKFQDLSPIDILAFGFPCNDFSIVGEQKGIDGVYGPLYTYGIKLLKYFKPMCFFAENVGGLKNANDGKTFSKILTDLFDAGYNVVAHLYQFENYNVPQARHRIIIIGFLKETGHIFKIPNHTSKVSISAKQAIENPPIKKDAFNNEITKQASQVIERLSYIKPGENAFTADLPEHLRLQVKGAKISQIYKRLDPDKPAYTLTGSGGGGTHMYHWSENRALTNRERARLQTFPDTYKFCGSKESVRKQIGMAVPPKGAEIIFNAILKTIAGVEYPYIEPKFLPLIHEQLYNSYDYYGQLKLLEKKQLYG